MTIQKRLRGAVRWRWILARSRLDPHSLERPTREPGPNDFIVAGCPRTGTTMLAGAIHNPPRSVVVTEPWDGLRLPPGDLFASLRQEIETGSLSRGRMNLEELNQGSVTWQSEFETSHHVQTEPGFQLGVKWPTFWQYLDYLPNTRFIITVRDPVEVVTSLRRQQGTLSEGLEYDVVFNRRMNRDLRAATDDPEERTILLYEYVYSRIIPHLERPNVLLVRYEHWSDRPDELRSRISEFLGTEVRADIGVRPTQSHDDPKLSQAITRLAPSAASLGYVR